MYRTSTESYSKHRSHAFPHYHEPVLYGSSDADSEDLSYPVSDRGLPVSPFTVQFPTHTHTKPRRWSHALHTLTRGFPSILCGHDSAIDSDSASTSSRVLAAKPLMSTDEPVEFRNRSESLVSRLSHELRSRVSRQR